MLDMVMDEVGDANAIVAAPDVARACLLAPETARAGTAGAAAANAGAEPLDDPPKPKPPVRSPGLLTDAMSAAGACFPLCVSSAHAGGAFTFAFAAETAGADA